MLGGIAYRVKAYLLLAHARTPKVATPRSVGHAVTPMPEEVKSHYHGNREDIKPTTAWTFKDANSKRGSEQFIDLGFDKEVFPKPKPIGTLKRFIHLLCPPEEHCLVLDFFPGSGALAQAVFQQNLEKGTNAQFILVQLPDHNEISNLAKHGGFKSISYIGKKRIWRSALEIKKKFNKINIDLGSKSFKLDRSCFKLWNGATEDIDDTDLFQQIESHADHLSTPSMRLPICSTNSRLAKPILKLAAILRSDWH